MYNEVELFYEPRNTVSQRLQLPNGEPEMSEFESAFLCGMLKQFKPKTILEVGIAGGGTSAIIMECMSSLDLPCEIFSMDLLDNFYVDVSKKSGYLADEYRKFVSPKVKQTIITGKLAHEQMPQSLCNGGGGAIDCLILDTVHKLPGEILDFIALFPYLSPNAVVIMHDIALNHYVYAKSPSLIRANVNKVLLDNVVAKKYFMKDPDAPQRCGFPNIGAFELTEQTAQNLNNVVSALSSTWYYIPNKQHLDSYSKRILEVLDDEGKWLYESIVNMQIATLGAKYNKLKLLKDLINKDGSLLLKIVKFITRRG